MKEKKRSVFDLHLGAEMKLREARRTLIEQTRHTVTASQEEQAYLSSSSKNRNLEKTAILVCHRLNCLTQLDAALKKYDQAEAAVAKTRQKVMDTTYGPIRKPPTRATSSASPRSSAPAKSRSKSSGRSTKRQGPPLSALARQVMVHQMLKESAEPPKRPSKRGPRPKYLKRVAKSPKPRRKHPTRR